ncbi:hypothetical protein N9Y42_10050, partial [Mariniblastus sp.]|nr:hypothetical protein [Mariniblastus sp.]
MQTFTLEHTARKPTYILDSPRPANSDERICHFHQAQPEFVRSRGSGWSDENLMPFAKQASLDLRATTVLVAFIS